MLASITPLGERGRNSRWSLTLIAFTLGASVAGALVGTATGAVGRALLPASFDPAARLVTLALAAAVAIVLDIRGVPGPHRQVDERWLHEFRGWAYGLGYGGQLGIGIATVVSSAATYLALLAALLVGDAGRGALIMGSYGLIRGLSLLVAAGVRTTDQLVALHARLDRTRRGMRGGGIAALAAVFAAALAGAAL